MNKTQILLNSLYGNSVTTYHYSPEMSDRVTATAQAILQQLIFERTKPKFKKPKKFIPK